MQCKSSELKRERENGKNIDDDETKGKRLFVGCNLIIVNLFSKSMQTKNLSLSGVHRMKFGWTVLFEHVRC